MKRKKTITTVTSARLTLKNILVPIDFSEMSLGVLAVATDLATQFGATVHLVNVHEYYLPPDTLIAAPAIPVSLMTALDEGQEAAKQRLKEIAEDHDCTSSCRVRLGAPVYNEIALTAREVKADLIVTPTHGYTGWKHVVLGSTAERMVQHSPCPVFVARRRPSKRARSHVLPPIPAPINKIMVPVDFSGCSLEGLKYAIGFADRVGAKLIVVNVFFKGPAYTADGFAMYDLGPLEEEAQETVEKEMARFIRQVKFGNIPYATEVKIGPMVRTLTTFAEEHRIDLIITSTHGRTGFSHVMIGSTAEQLVRHAPCSVLAVPSHPAVRKQQLALTDTADRRHLNRSIRKAETVCDRAAVAIAR